MASTHTSPASSDRSRDSAGSDIGWEIQEILAERTSLSGENEILVVWKPGWIPKGNLMEGHIRDAWETSQKWSTTKTVAGMRMEVLLPVMPHTQLAADLEMIARNKRQRLESPIHVPSSSAESGD
jgi:hypothetical protein